MGCSISTEHVDEPQDAVIEEEVYKDPDNVKAKITVEYGNLLKLRDEIAIVFQEKFGIDELLREDREKLVELLEQKEDMIKKRDDMAAMIWEKDSDLLNGILGKRVNLINIKDLNGSDLNTQKEIVLNTLCLRTNWQIELIKKCYAKKYNRDLYEDVDKFLSGALGSLSGPNPTIQFLWHRLTPQPVRDAKLLKDYTSGLSLNNDLLIEFARTRRNAELKAAMDTFVEKNAIFLPDIIAKKATYKNYKEFMKEVLKCEKDETNFSLDDDMAQAYADELYNAGAAKGMMYSVDAEPFIRILSTINPVSFDSINAKYPKQQLIKDITSKIGGEFRSAILAMCTDKYEYLATRVKDACSSSDVDGLIRIFGCSPRSECSMIRHAYESKYTGSSLSKVLQANVRDKYLLQAFLLLVENNVSDTPFASDAEEDDDEKKTHAEGHRARFTASVNYKQKDIVAKGRSYINSDKYVISDEEKDVMEFQWDDDIALYSSGKQLLRMYHDCFESSKLIKRILIRLTEEISEQRTCYFGIYSHKYEAETWIGILSAQTRALEGYQKRRIKTLDKINAPKKK